MSFTKFKRAVQVQFANMRTLPLFQVDMTGEELWQLYLQSFPEETNKIYRVREEHNCSACRQFIKIVGGLVATAQGKLITLWDVDPTGLDPEYIEVARALSQAVKSRQILNRFVHDQRIVGTDRNFEELLDGECRAWEHFRITLPQNCIIPKVDIAGVRARWGTAHDLLMRALQTITKESVETVLDLIAQNSLYRGQEFKHVVEQFQAFRTMAYALPEDRSLDIHVWNYVYANGPNELTHIRGNVIGTLLVDLSKGTELESAVTAFEAKVAPMNYKRPTALVTKAMVEGAKAKLKDLGLLPALERRHATARDIDINDVIWVGPAYKKEMAGDIFDSLTVEKLPKLDRVQDVPVEDFLVNILPTATKLELLVENRHTGNLVSLITAVDGTASRLFKWNNPFSWSYRGDVADSLKERVKRAGGNVSGELCCRLAWGYTDDLDFHMYEPNGGHIYYNQHRRSLSDCGGMLDLDANGSDGMKDDPVENIFYQSIDKMQQGTYKLAVHNFTRRSDGVGFEVEIDLKGQITSMIYGKVLSQNKYLTVAHIHKAGNEVTVESLLPSNRKSKAIWGINTEVFTPVKLVTLSPNHWKGTIGNKHYIFMLEGCRAEEPARGFYNEFLRSDLDQHRKVLEMVGSKVRTELADSQLSGVGFSSTQRNRVTCRVSGSFHRIINIIF